MMRMKIFFKVRYQRKENVKCVASMEEGARDVTGSTTAVSCARRKTGKSTNHPVWHVKVISRNGEGTPEEQILSTFDGDLILEACRFQIQTPDSFCFLLHFELNPGGYRKKFQIPSKTNLKVRFRNQLTPI